VALDHAEIRVNLHPPARSAQQGAVLELHLTVPPPTIEKLGSITLSASIGGAALAPETYSKAGEYTYRRDVPAKRWAAIRRASISNWIRRSRPASGQARARHSGVQRGPDCEMIAK
jgi:hypothetical protein